MTRPPNMFDFDPGVFCLAQMPLPRSPTLPCPRLRVETEWTPQHFPSLPPSVADRIKHSFHRIACLHNFLFPLEIWRASLSPLSLPLSRSLFAFHRSRRFSIRLSAPGINRARPSDPRWWRPWRAWSGWWTGSREPARCSETTAAVTTLSHPCGRRSLLSLSSVDRFLLSALSLLQFCGEMFIQSGHIRWIQTSDWFDQNSDLGHFLNYPASADSVLLTLGVTMWFQLL